MNILNLALANIKKGKGAALSLFVLILMAALLLNIGLTIITQIGSFYDNKVEQLNDPHVGIIMNKTVFSQSQEDFLRSNSSASVIEKEEIILMGAAKFRYGDSEMSSGAAILNAEVDRHIAPMKLIEKLDSSRNDGIYLSYSFKSGGGYKLGEDFTIIYQDMEYSYPIAGFFEATMLGTNNMGIMKFHLPDAAYRQLSEKLGDQADGILLSARLDDSTQSSELLNEYNKHFPYSNIGGSSNFYYSSDIEMIKSINTMTVNIVAMILVVFAVVMVLVSLIVIKFRVTNSIDDGMTNIAVLKAVGYTSKQILASITLQFMLITLSAGVIGIAISYAVMPVFGGIITTLSGLGWTQSFDVLINLTSILVVVLLVLSVTILSSIRIRKLPPVEALRGGIQTHSFRKNHFPLDKARGDLQFVLACKTMLMNIKQNMMIAAIMAAITFASVFSIVLYYNIVADKTAFVHLVGVETSNVVVQAKSGEDDNDKILKGIEQIEGVAKVTHLDVITSKIDGQTVYTNVSNDYNRLENKTVFEGRYPLHDNEISISWVVSKLIDKKIGDTVEVEVEGAAHTYLITGLSQSINNLGIIADLTLPGFHHLIPDYTAKTIHVYLEGTETKSFINNLRAQNISSIHDIVDIEESLESQTRIYTSAVLAVMVMILAITILVVIMILYLVIRTMILKRKKELGIMKAIGYTTFQLMTQITLSFVPIVILGVTIGGLMGALYSNSLLTLLLSSAGIHNVQFIVNIPVIVLLAVSLVVLAYLVSMLVSRRIKRISAYGLITE